ncbi:SCG1 protein, partial [Turnix velox]|nr:SCG1 protein [Turnix velox]
LLGVSTIPVEKDHVEEMVMQCIVEVLSNALAKPNAPPINPECEEILKKSGRNDRERSENNQLEARLLKDSAEMEEQHTESMEKEQRQAEEESKKLLEGNDEKNLAHQEGQIEEEEEDGHHLPLPEETIHREEKKGYQEIQGGEKRYHSEEESKENSHHDEEVEQDLLNMKSRTGGVNTEEFPGGNDEPPMEGGMQSPYKRISGGEEGEKEKREKYHSESEEQDFSHQQEQEQSVESEKTEEEMQPYTGKGYQRKHRMGDSSEEKRGRGREREEPSEKSNTVETHLWDNRNHHQKYHEESEQQHEEKRGSHGRQGSAGAEEKRRGEQGSEESRERWQQSEENGEDNHERHHHSEESNEKWREERRQHDGSHEGRKHHYSEGMESEEEAYRYLGAGSKNKQHHAGGSYHPWDNEDEGSKRTYAQEGEEQARRHHSTEENMEWQRYLGHGEEEEKEVEKKHHISHQMGNQEENMEEGRYTERERYRSHLPVEIKKRTMASYSPLYPLLWWKSHQFEKRDGIGQQHLEGKEEGRPTLSKKGLFPQYSDYDWWEKKQLLNALNNGGTEQKNLSRIKRYDVKRQYEKMDELAELLNYRKKSEFTELNNSGEDVRKRHVIRKKRPLTEEEEKKLENLAAMDLELQKIVEKFNEKRRS